MEGDSKGSAREILSVDQTVMGWGMGWGESLLIELLILVNCIIKTLTCRVDAVEGVWDPAHSLFFFPIPSSRLVGRQENAPFSSL